jgi:5-methylcytosine-specific restriction enzyme B
MAIPQNITSEHILKAADIIDRNGIPRGREADKWEVIINGKRYPPKYIVCLANKFPNGMELYYKETRTGKAQDYLMKLGFKIVPK